MKPSAWLVFALVIGAATLVSASPPARFSQLLGSVQSARNGESGIKGAPTTGGVEQGVFDESRWDDDAIYQ
jgi:hypothetical protein